MKLVKNVVIFLNFRNLNCFLIFTALLNKGNQKEHAYLYWEFHELGGRQAIRQGDWKLIRYNLNKKENYQLYNLENDLAEAHDLASKMPEKVAELSKIMESSRTESDVFKFK